MCGGSLGRRAGQIQEEVWLGAVSGCYAGSEHEEWEYMG